MQLGTRHICKDLRISAEGRLAPISKLRVFNNVIYLMQTENTVKKQIYFKFSCVSDCEVARRDFIITAKWILSL